MTLDLSSSLCVYVGALIGLWGAVWTHNAFKDTEKFRGIMKEAGFFDLVLNNSSSSNDGGKQSPEDHDREAAACMRRILVQFPSTVSEMVHDSSSTHGIVFRCLLAACGIVSYRSDYSALTIGADAWPILSQFRAILAFVGAFGTAFGPMHKAGYTTEYFKANSVAFKRGSMTFEEYEKLQFYTFRQSLLHVAAAFSIFIFSPLFETFTILVSFRELINREFDVTAAVVYSVIQVVRLFLFYCMISHFGYFGPKSGLANNLRGFGGEQPMHSYRSFKSEFTLVVGFIQSQLLLGITGFIDVRLRWNDSPIFVTALYAFAAWHVFKIVPSQIKLLKAYVWNDNVEFTQEELCSIFSLWKESELIIRKGFENQNEMLKTQKEAMEKESEKQSEVKEVWKRASIILEEEKGQMGAAPLSFRSAGLAIMLANSIIPEDGETNILSRSGGLHRQRVQEDDRVAEKED